MAMWGRKDHEENTASTSDSAATPQPAAAKSAEPRGQSMDPRKAHIGPSIQVKGELIGNEDLVIEGKVEGVVRLKDHHLTIGNQANIQATLEAKGIRVEGKVKGDVVASEKVELASGSALLGDIVSPRIVISDGARFKGSVDMEKKNAPGAHAAPAASKATASPATPNVARKPAGVSS